jgi:hypothetical protein
MTFVASNDWKRYMSTCRVPSIRFEKSCTNGFQEQIKQGIRLSSSLRVFSIL